MTAPGRFTLAPIGSGGHRPGSRVTGGQRPALPSQKPQARASEPGQGPVLPRSGRTRGRPGPQPQPSAGATRNHERRASRGSTTAELGADRTARDFLRSRSAAADPGSGPDGGPTRGAPGAGWGGRGSRNWAGGAAALHVASSAAGYPTSSDAVLDATRRGSAPRRRRARPPVRRAPTGDSTSRRRAKRAALACTRCWAGHDIPALISADRWTSWPAAGGPRPAHRLSCAPASRAKHGPATSS